MPITHSKDEIMTRIRPMPESLAYLESIGLTSEVVRESTERLIRASVNARGGTSSSASAPVGERLSSAIQTPVVAAPAKPATPKPWISPAKHRESVSGSSRDPADIGQPVRQQNTPPDAAAIVKPQPAATARKPSRWITAVSAFFVGLGVYVIRLLMLFVITSTCLISSSAWSQEMQSDAPEFRQPQAHPIPIPFELFGPIHHRGFHDFSGPAYAPGMQVGWPRATSAADVPRASRTAPASTMPNTLQSQVDVAVDKLPDSQGESTQPSVDETVLEPVSLSNKAVDPFADPLDEHWIDQAMATQLADSAEHTVTAAERTSYQVAPMSVPSGATIVGRSMPEPAVTTTKTNSIERGIHCCTSFIICGILGIFAVRAIRSITSGYESSEGNGQGTWSAYRGESRLVPANWHGPNASTSDSKRLDSPSHEPTCRQRSASTSLASENDAHWNDGRHDSASGMTAATTAERRQSLADLAASLAKLQKNGMSNGEPIVRDEVKLLEPKRADRTCHVHEGANRPARRRPKTTSGDSALPTHLAIEEEDGSRCSKFHIRTGLKEQIWATAAQSICGPVRKQNQDCCMVLELDDCSAVLVADGCGGEPRGAMAARLATQGAFNELLAVLNRKVWEPSLAVEPAMQAASQRVRRFAAEHAIDNGLNTTLIIALATPERYHLGYIGDGGACVLRDDGNVETLIIPQREGHSNRITGCLGPQQIGHAEFTTLERHPGDLLVVGSDGVFDFIGDEADFLSLIKEQALLDAGQLPQTVNTILASLASEQDESGFICEDNLTLAVIGNGPPAVVASAN